MIKRKRPTPPLKRKPLELPSDLAQRFVRDMRKFHAERNPFKRDEIAAGTLHDLKRHYTGRLRVPDVKRMFDQMRDA